MAKKRIISFDRPDFFLDMRIADLLQRGASFLELRRFTRDMRSLHDEWERRAEKAQKAECTDRNHAALRRERAKLRQDYEQLKRLRDRAGCRYIDPYSKQQMAWDENVDDYYQWADKAYRFKIDSYDDREKAVLLKELEGMYAELREELGIRWLPLDKALKLSGIRLTLGEKLHGDPEARRRALTLTLEHIGIETAKIADMDDGPAIMAAYMDCLSIPEAEAQVAERRRREREARDALRHENGGREIMEDVEFRVSGCTREELERLRGYLTDRAIAFE